MILMYKDALQVYRDEPRAVLVHQVNCQGVMNSGIARQIRHEYPDHYEDYLKYQPKELGQTVWTLEGPFKGICGVFGQKYYGYDKRRYTSYVGLTKGLLKVFQEASRLDCAVILPKYLGCDRGGGDWDFVEQLLVDLEAMYPVRLIIAKI